MLFDFENAEIGYWSRWKQDMTTVDLEQDDVFDGTYSLMLTYQQGTEGTNYHNQLCTFGHPTPLSDLSAYTNITYMAKESPFSDTTVAIWISETNGQKWMQRKLTTLTDNWQQVSVVLKSKYDDAEGFDSAALGVGASGTNTVLDLNMIAEIGFEFNKGTTNSKAPEWTTFYIDNVALSTDPIPPYASMMVTNESIAFGDITPMPDAYRIVSVDSATLKWETSGMEDVSWGLYAYTTDPEGKQGLKGETYTDFYLPFRWWTGPNKDAVPSDPMTLSIWTNEYGHVLDQYHPKLRPMLTTEGKVAADATGSFELHFAIDISDGAAIQTYSSPVTVELRIDN